MVKRRRPSTAADTATTAQAGVADDDGDDSPMTRTEQDSSGQQQQQQQQQHPEEGGEAAVDNAAVEERGERGAGDKRKRKRTRTRKKKGAEAAAAAAAPGGDSASAAVRGVGESAASGGGEMLGVTDTVYVEGIPWTCDESDVRDFFKGCGKITGVRMPRWQDSGRPRGYAHVSFAGSSGARAAFTRDGQYLKGRYLTIQAPQEPATEKARRANRTAEQPRGCRTVFVKNLPYDVDENLVQDALAGCGRIASVRLAMWNHTRKLKGFGYVEFSTERGAETCVRTQEGLSIGGRPVVVDFETGAPKGSFRRQDGAQIKKTSADAGVGKGKAPKFKVHV